MVLSEVAYKTNGHCAECFRNKANEILEAALVVVSGRERITLRTVGGKTRSPGERAQRRRGKRRAAKTPRGMERARLYQMARARADARLRALFPELWEVIIADERAKLGLDAWTLDRALTPGTADADLTLLTVLRRLN